MAPDEVPSQEGSAAAAERSSGNGMTPPGPGFALSTGLVVEQVTGTRVEGHVELGPTHHTPWGIVHGGLYATIAETVASVGASAAVAGSGRYAVGLNNSTDFLRPMTAGRADVIAVPVHQGRTQQLWQVVICRTDDGKEIARSTIRLQNVSLRT